MRRKIVATAVAESTGGKPVFVSEIAISRNCEENLIEQALTKALTKCNLRFPEISELAS